MRVELDFDTISALYEIDPLTGEILRDFDKVAIFPAKEFAQHRASFVASRRH
ncbi:MAG TPA: hypothetical protein VEJ63_18450 [Planctomycetota bacterium]|nr:hypothetical protein [Planctomycetota bacterium]